MPAITAAVSPTAQTTTSAALGWSSLHDQHLEQSDLSAIAREAQVGSLGRRDDPGGGVMPDDAAHAFDTAEIGYYEADSKACVTQPRH